ncbi:MAG TPA: TonB-dependent receptor [Cyclobacteriaceae bacterium]|nr:TonB-dependent receptor [Cyclobacteriaceae bacterium]
MINLKQCFFVMMMIAGASPVLKAQYALKIQVKDAVTDENLPGASVIFREGNGTSTGVDGMAEFENLVRGESTFKVSYVGYKDTTLTVTIPQVEFILVKLQPVEEELEAVVISSTRTNSRIEDLPLRVEVLGLEEMDEESTLVPGNVASILGDLGVITIQRTNPVNGNDAIRMQGLDPQYMLITRDGLPLYGGFSGSLGVLSIPPLDLKQVEIIKGSVSTLYGGGAIAGMINFISKEPGSKPQRTVLLNLTTLKEKNLNTFFSGKISPKVGYTLFAGANIKSAFDVNDDGFTEVPENQNYTIHPRFFITGKKSHVNVGITGIFDHRKTGDAEAVRNDASASHPYLRKERTSRHVIDLQYDHEWSSKHAITFKTAISSFSRELDVPVINNPDFSSRGIQYSTYSEVNDRLDLGRHTLVTGINLISESFRNKSFSSVPIENYNYITGGLFAQDDWIVSDKFTVEMGLRVDYHNFKGIFVLPRVALYYKPSDDLSIRLASGSGYKAPNVFSLSDPNPYLVNNIDKVTSEKSFGINADINYTILANEDFEININQAFYYAHIDNPVRIISDTVNLVRYMENENFNLNSLGTDTYVQAVYKHWELYLGYNHTEAVQKYAEVNNPVPFNPKDKLALTLAYSRTRWRSGVEAAYTMNQFIYDDQNYYESKTLYPSVSVPNFWFFAAMVEYRLGFGSVVLNVENLFDARQSKFENLVEGDVLDPVFKPIWAPLDGRVVNLSFKVNL